MGSLNIKAIIVGWFNFLFKSQPSFFYDRFTICVKCENKGRFYICKDCGCHIPAKCAYKGSACKYWIYEEGKM